MSREHLHFLSDIGREKFAIQGSDSQCPFCNRDALAEIIDEDGSILLVKNKYQTLVDTVQTVLIETEDCTADITSYDSSYIQRIISFGIDHWLKMEASGAFRSVAFFKNHGPLSGGSINHAHMQIVGLKNIDYRLNLNDEIFEGVEIYRGGNSVLNISTKPLACAMEFNLITTPRDDVFMAEKLQKIVRYILTQCGSFNLFFYRWNGSIICKVIPRYVTSPFLIGYSIPQTTSRLQQIVEEVKRIMR